MVKQAIKIFILFALFSTALCLGGCCLRGGKCMNYPEHIGLCENTETEFSKSVCLEIFGPFYFYNKELKIQSGCVSNEEIEHATSKDIMRVNVAISLPFFYMNWRNRIKA